MVFHFLKKSLLSHDTPLDELSAEVVAQVPVLNLNERDRLYASWSGRTFSTPHKGFPFSRGKKVDTRQVNPLPDLRTPEVVPNHHEFVHILRNKLVPTFQLHFVNGVRTRSRITCDRLRHSKFHSSSTKAMYVLKVVVHVKTPLRASLKASAA